MAAKTTHEMIATLDLVTAYARIIDDLLRENFSVYQLLKFRQAMAVAGMNPERVDETTGALNSYVTTMRESAELIRHHVGPAQHCISAGAHRATLGSAQDLVL